MKKFAFVLTLFLAVFAQAVTCPDAEATDVYCGTYPDGRDVYLMTETVTGNLYHINCKVKAVRGRSVDFITYTFDADAGAASFSNSEGKSGAFGGRRRVNEYPVATKIFETAYELLR